MAQPGPVDHSVLIQDCQLLEHRHNMVSQYAAQLSLVHLFSRHAEPVLFALPSLMTLREIGRNF